MAPSDGEQIIGVSADTFDLPLLAYVEGQGLLVGGDVGRVSTLASAAVREGVLQTHVRSVIARHDKQRVSRWKLTASQVLLANDPPQMSGHELC